MLCECLAKRCIFNLDLAPNIIRRLFESLRVKCEKALPPLLEFDILGTINRPEFCDII